MNYRLLSRFVPRKKISQLIRLFLLACFIAAIVYLSSDSKLKTLAVWKLRTIRTYYFENYHKSLPYRDVHLPGELGKDVKLSDDEQKRADVLFKKEAFNIIASDKVALDRSLRDTRDKQCATLTYPEDLPTASVIIIYHNEAWSPLLRTVHSVVNRSPWMYLQEVILLDDASDREELVYLEEYVLKTWPEGIVRIVHKKQRQGLIRARLEGAKAATGDVIIFLDSHCEANEGWLEPLLARIKEKRSAILCPEIDNISDKTLRYDGTGSYSVGGFWWALHFGWDMIPSSEHKRRISAIDPIRSPTMAGGLFAADRKYFFEIGSYDEDMEVWGGENLEISFRVWMCGGSLEFIPCSRVGHIFRSSHPYTFPGNKDTHGINSARLAEVWMDDYKRLFYLHRPELRDANIGDVSKRTALRKRLKCHSFKWYLDNVFPDKYIIDEHSEAWGYLWNKQSNLALDLLGKDEKLFLKIGVYGRQLPGSTQQIFSLSKWGELRREKKCAVVKHDDKSVILDECDVDHNKTEHKWRHDRDTSMMMHVASNKCLDANALKAGDVAKVEACVSSSYQEWSFSHYNTPKQPEVV